MRPFRVLLVEDNRDHAELQTDMLLDGSDGIEVTHVADGQAALDHLNQHRMRRRQLPNLILLDISLPGQSGLDVLDRIKRDQDLQSIPTVILSTSTAPEDIRRAMRAHANSYASKTEDIEEMEQKILQIREYWMTVNAG